MTAYQPFLTNDISSTKYYVSDRAWVICKVNGLSIIKDFLDHYFAFKTFTNLKGCGDKLNSELVTLAQRLYTLIPEEDQSLVNKDDLIYDNNDIPLSDYSFKRLSIRAINVCGFNGLRSLNSILNYYIVHNGFIGFRNCGIKTENELKVFCEEEILKKKGNGDFVLEVGDRSVDKRNIIDAFTPYKKSIVNSYYKYLLTTLNIRAKNCLLSFSNSIDNAGDIYTKIFDPLFDLSDVRNAGVKTIKELESFIKNLGSFIDNINEVHDELYLRKEFLKVALKGLFKTKDDSFLESINCYGEEGKIRMFKLIKLMVDNDLIFNQKEKVIFNCIYTDCNYNVEKTCSNLNLTKERFRQIKIRIQREMDSYFQFIKTFKLSDIYLNGIDVKSNCIVVDREVKEKINTNEEVSFNDCFYSEMLGFILNDSYCQLKIETNKKIKTRYNNFNGSNYLIKKELINSFDFNFLFEDIRSRLLEKINKQYSLYFSGYIEQFFGISKSYRNEVNAIVEQILYNEFELVLDENRFLVFEANTKNQIYDYIVQTLEEANAFLNVQVITEKLSLEYPEMDINSSIVRSVLQRNRQTFIFIGRSSTYGLRTWEQEKEDVKGGTIRDIVENFLTSQEIPVHISDVTKHVKKFRKTNDKNVFTNLKLEDNRRFVFYSGGFVGLKNKQYGNYVNSLKRVRGTHFREAVLKRFSGNSLKDIISYYVKVHKYQPSQVEYILLEKERKGMIKFDKNKTLSYE